MKSSLMTITSVYHVGQSIKQAPFFFLIFKATVHRELPKRLEPDMLECWIHLTLWLGHSDNPNSGWSTQDTWLLVVPWSDIQSTRIQK